tara:strand:+ start:145 stop:375 length:231 start_codon:yes stop_codon:yes gene_type:complete
MSWENILKNQAKVMQRYSEVKRRYPHFWEEAQQLAGQGEVATLDSIVMRTIKDNLNKDNVIQLASIAAENYIIRGV